MSRAAATDRTGQSARRLHSFVGRQHSHRTLQSDAHARLVALDVDPWLVEEYRFVRSQTSGNGRHNISRTGKARFAMADAAAALSPLRVKPLINEIEIGTAMVDLAVAVTCELPGLDDDDGFRAAVPHPRQGFREVDSGVRVVSDPEHQDLAIEFVDAADRTVQTVRHVYGMIGSNAGGFRSDGRKSVRAITPKRTPGPGIMAQRVRSGPLA
jgi:hypothetical protein